jgi:hypothetical protein|tara:strand:+ start:1729 stop:2652 length:924 start_codon:yes stop_codon:yes gene_type:complete
MKFLKDNIESNLSNINEELSKYNVHKNEKSFKEYTERCYNFFKSGGKTEVWGDYINNINIQNKYEIDDMDFKSINHNHDSIYVHLGLGIGLGHGQGNHNMESILFEMFSNKITNLDNIMTICKKNDSIGKPYKIKTNNLDTISIDNIRYIIQSLSILKYMKDININNINIIEIGGGYGGLSYYIKNLSNIYNINISSYTIYDLKEVSVFQKKVQDYLDNKIITKNIPDNSDLKENSFLITNYALSELTEDLIKQYNDIVLPYIKNGYITWNCIPFDINYINKIKFTNNQNINIDIEEFCQNDLIIKF